MILTKNVPAHRARRNPLDDSAHATQLLHIGAPIACPTCGSHTRPADTREGWVCLDPACVWS
ncbi:MAG: hypothetical protein ABJD68_08300 [Nakamurella sp.]